MGGEKFGDIFSKVADSHRGRGGNRLLGTGLLVGRNGWEVGGKWGEKNGAEGQRKMMNAPLRVVVNDRVWHLFDCEYDTADGKFSFYIYALSMEHAAAMLQELKATAKLLGQVTDVIPAGG